jgi:hypothetical protein
MLTNIGHVTETLKTLIEGVLVANGLDSADFTVTGAPPDAAGPGERIVSVYMFHVLESPDLKNLPPTAGSGSVPIRHEPMGLILQYLVTVVTPEDEDLTHGMAVEQQRLIGFIARGVHDHPIISDKTRSPADDLVQVLHQDLQGIGTVLRVNLRPATMEETVNFWAAQDKNVPRLSLFVEVRVILLEAQPPEVAPGIVLSVGQFVFTSADPQLIASRSTTWFLPPPNRAPRSVQASPARVALFDSDGSAALGDLDASQLENNRLTLDGTGLGPGKRILVLRSPNETIRIVLDHQVPQVIPALNVQWQLTATSSSVSLRVFQVVADVEGVERTVTPGFYTARVIVLDERAGGVARPRSSNEIPFMIVPQIVSVVPTATIDLYTLTLVTASIAPDAEVVFSVGGRALTANNTAASGALLAPGEYRALFGGTDPDFTPASMIEFKLPPSDPAVPASPPPVPSDDNPLTIRLVIDGVTATPEWLTEQAPVGP